jgi:hypothetical protein
MDLLEEIKSYISNPTYYIYKHFESLRRHIDFAFINTLPKNDVEHTKYKYLIETIQTLETRTINELNNNKSKHCLFNNQIISLEVEIKNKLTIINDIKKKINDLKYDIGKLLFANKTIFILLQHENESNILVELRGIYVENITKLDNLKQLGDNNEIEICKAVVHNWFAKGYDKNDYCSFYGLRLYCSAQEIYNNLSIKNSSKIYYQSNQYSVSKKSSFHRS